MKIGQASMEAKNGFIYFCSQGPNLDCFGQNFKIYNKPANDN